MAIIISLMSTALTIMTMSRTTSRPTIPRLARIVREEISRMLNQGVSAEAILAKVKAGDEGSQLTLDDITNWQKTGHQEWLEERERLADLERVRDFAQEITGSRDGASVHSAWLCDIKIST